MSRANRVTKTAEVKQKLLNFFSNETYNTFTVKEARARFKVRNIAYLVDQLRAEGHAIYRNPKVLSDGTKTTYYNLGAPNKRYLKYLKLGKIKNAIAALEIGR